MFLREPPRAPIVQPVVAEIDTLEIRTAFRRQHVGARLVAAALDWASVSEAARTELGVYEFNDPAPAHSARRGASRRCPGAWSCTPPRTPQHQRFGVAGGEHQRGVVVLSQNVCTFACEARLPSAILGRYTWGIAVALVARGTKSA